MSWTRWGPIGRVFSSSSFSFLQPVSEQAQQKLPPPALFKLDNQVQSGGAEEEWVGPEGRGGPGRWKQGNGGGETIVMGLMFRGSEGMGKEGLQRDSPLLRSGTRPLLPCSIRAVRDTENLELLP